MQFNLVVKTRQLFQQFESSAHTWCDLKLVTLFQSFFRPRWRCKLLRSACLYVCLRVCLFVCPLTNLKPHVQILPNLQHMLPVAVVSSMATYRDTDHATCNVCSNSPHLHTCMQAMRPKMGNVTPTTPLCHSYASTCYDQHIYHIRCF